MNNQPIKRILFEDSAIFRLVNEDDFGSDEDEIQEHAVNLMLNASKSDENISERDAEQYYMEAAGLPKDLLDRDMPYIRYDDICEYIKLIKNDYHIGLVVMDKESARKALGSEYKEIFNDIIEYDELQYAPRYLLEDCLYVTMDPSSGRELRTLCRVYEYKNLNSFAQYLASPPPFASATFTSTGFSRALYKLFLSALTAVAIMSKPAKLFIDGFALLVFAIGVAYIFPNEAKEFYDNIRSLVL